MSTELQTVCSLMLTNTFEQQDAPLEIALPLREEPNFRYTITCKCETRAFQYLQREAKGSDSYRNALAFQVSWPRRGTHYGS